MSQVESKSTDIYDAPWSVADYKTLGTDAHVIRSAERGRDNMHPVVASIPKRPGYKAMAHLIAAAPDLLRVALDCEVYIERAVDGESSATENALAMLASLRAAISKATGG